MDKLLETLRQLETAGFSGYVKVLFDAGRPRLIEKSSTELLDGAHVPSYEVGAGKLERR